MPHNAVKHGNVVRHAKGDYSIAHVNDDTMACIKLAVDFLRSHVDVAPTLISPYNRAILDQLSRNIGDARG